MATVQEIGAAVKAHVKQNDDGSLSCTEKQFQELCEKANWKIVGAEARNYKDKVFATFKDGALVLKARFVKAAFGEKPKAEKKAPAKK